MQNTWTLVLASWIITWIADSIDIWHTRCLSQYSHSNTWRSAFLQHLLQRLMHKFFLGIRLQKKNYIIASEGTFSTLTAQNLETMMCWIKCYGAGGGRKQYFFSHVVVEKHPSKFHPDLIATKKFTLTSLFSLVNSNFDLWFTSKISRTSSQPNVTTFLNPKLLHSYCSSHYKLRLMAAAWLVCHFLHHLHG